MRVDIPLLINRIYRSYCLLRQELNNYIKSTDIFRSVFFKFFNPSFHDLKWSHRSDVINAKCYFSLSVVNGCDWFVLLLSCSVPNLDSKKDTWNSTTFLSSGMVNRFVMKAAPMVGYVNSLNLSCANLVNILLFPTPLSPTAIVLICNIGSYVVICFGFIWSLIMIALFFLNIKSMLYQIDNALFKFYRNKRIFSKI